MAVDIKKILMGFKGRKETMLVWGLGAVAFCLGLFLLIGYMQEAPLPISLDVVVRKKKPVKSKEAVAAEAIARLKESQKIPPFISYQDILTKNLFIQSRMVQVEEKRIVRVGGFVLKGIWEETERVVAFIQDPGGRAYSVGAGQTVGTSKVKVVAIDFKNQSVALMGPGWEKPQVIWLAKRTLGTKDTIIFQPGKKQPSPEKSAELTKEAARRAIASARRAISKADKAIVDAVTIGIDTSEAVEKRDAAQEKLTRAQEVSLTKEYAQAKALALLAEKLAKEAVLLVEEAMIAEEEQLEEEEE